MIGQMRSAKPFYVVALIVLWFVATSGARAFAASHERILDYRSLIEVQTNGDLTVSETIVVVATGQKIKRGIYREFLTMYVDEFGNGVNVGFDVTEVLRDGAPTPYHLRDVPFGKRVYIGEEDVFLEPGQYSYRLTYTTSGQLRIHHDFDKLFWNVIDPSWEFSIERGEAIVVLPEGASALKLKAYTGYRGERREDYTVP